MNPEIWASEKLHILNKYIWTAGPVASHCGRNCRTGTSPPHAVPAYEICFRLCNMGNGWQSRFLLASLECKHRLHSNFHAQRCLRRQSCSPPGGQTYRRANTSAQTQACLAFERSIFMAVSNLRVQIWMRQAPISATRTISRCRMSLYFSHDAVG